MSSFGHDKDGYDDDVISFFIHCYHVRDWIIHLNNLDVTARQVDLYINNHRALKICSDLANGSKHCKLTRTMRGTSQPYIAEKKQDTSTWFTYSGGGEVMKCEYIIQSDGESFDALKLAAECVFLWESYVIKLAVIKTY